jgi:hypothetical protein
MARSRKVREKVGCYYRDEHARGLIGRREKWSWLERTRRARARVLLAEVRAAVTIDWGELGWRTELERKWRKVRAGRQLVTSSTLSYLFD